MWLHGYHGIESERAMRPAHESLFEVEAAVFEDGRGVTDHGTLLRLWFQVQQSDKDAAEAASTTAPQHDFS